MYSTCKSLPCNLQRQHNNRAASEDTSEPALGGVTAGELLQTPTSCNIRESGPSTLTEQYSKAGSSGMDVDEPNRDAGEDKGEAAQMV